MPYRLLIDLEIVGLLQALPPKRRRALFDHFRQIQQYPAAHFAYADTDSQGRRVDVSVFDGLAVYYWIDDADQQVKILDLIAADAQQDGR